MEIERAVAEQRAVERITEQALGSLLHSAGFHLVPQGFSALPSGEILHTVIYETSLHEYSSHYPELRRRFSGDVPCIDFSIRLVDRTLEPVLEGEPLEQVATSLGFSDVAQRLRESRASSRAEQLAVLREALTLVFGVTDESQRDDSQPH